MTAGSKTFFYTMLPHHSKLPHLTVLKCLMKPHVCLHYLLFDYFAKSGCEMGSTFKTVIYNQYCTRSSRNPSQSHTAFITSLREGVGNYGTHFYKKISTY